MPLDDDSATEEGLIQIAGREYGTRAYLARKFKVCERTIARLDLPRIRVGRFNIHDLSQIPERLAHFERRGRGK